jgi:CheY-like chemotaxis protein
MNEKGKKKIALVADNEGSSYDMVRLTLERQGHEVHFAMDAKRGLELVNVHQPSAVIIDLESGASRAAILQAMAKDSRRAPVPVAVLVSENEGGGLQSIAPRLCWFITRPVSNDDLLKQIDYMLSLA